jgi:hypothetical protein
MGEIIGAALGNLIRHALLGFIGFHLVEEYGLSGICRSLMRARTTGGTGNSSSGKA